MKKERKIPDLEQEALKKLPFEVPEGYFEGISARLHERIRQEEASKVPVRRIGTSTRLRVVMAAAIVCVALISYSIIRFTSPAGGPTESHPDVALLEEFHLIDDDSYFLAIIEAETEELDEEEAYRNQAIEYLATNDVEMDLIFE